MTLKLSGPQSSKPSRTKDQGMSFIVLGLHLNWRMSKPTSVVMRKDN